MGASAAPRRFFRPAWAEVDLARLQSNLRRFRGRMPSRVKLLFVVKANGYGHGAAPCAKAAERARLAEWLGVSSVEEGIALREAGLRLPILVLGGLYPFESFWAAAEYGLTPTVASFESARRLTEAAAARSRRGPLRCHIKIETGLNRIGVQPQEGLKIAAYLAGCRGVKVEGVYTHLACADAGRVFTLRQLARFKGAVDAMAAAGLKIALRHAANSAAALKYPESRWDMVRPGLAVYGLYPGFDPVLSLKTKVIFIKNVPQGSPIGYGASYRARRPSRIATIPMGYADGVSRLLSNRGSALIGGRRCPIVGKVSMDLSMVDVTRVPALVGDDAVLIGSQKDQRITAGEIAGLMGTVPYEVTCSISARVPRVYL